jgi:hypothetical protein
MPEATRMREFEFMQLSLFDPRSPALSRCAQKAGIKEREFMGQQ